MDSGILSRVLDDIREYGGDFVIEEFDVGHEAHDPSSARITVEAPDDESLQRLLMRLQTRGVNQLSHGDAAVATSEQDGVLPDGFYATTNLETQVRLGRPVVRRRTTPRWTAAWSSRSRPQATRGCGRCPCPTSPGACASWWARPASR